MIHEEFVQREAESWQALWAIAEGLDDEDWLVPGAAGEWNLKDVLAHLTAWQEEALAVLPEVARRVVAGTDEPIDYDFDAWNAAQHEKRRDLPLSEVREGLLSVREQLLAMLQRLPAEWLSSHEHIRGWAEWSTWRHYDDHLSDLRTWRQDVETGSSGE